MTIKMPHWPLVIDKYNINIEPGLSRMKNIMSFLDNPHLKINNIIHIAGTNGKGSTSAFMRKILEESGYTVNCFNSPALIRFNEEIILSGTMISDKYFFNVLERCRNTRCKVTFFEGITAAALLAFSEQTADFTILETGMGGRLDATNIIKPIVSIITKIALDHCNFLGNSLQDITREKAGIIKNNVKVIIGYQEQTEIYNILMRSAHNLNCTTYKFGTNWHVKDTNTKNFSYILNKKEKQFKLPSMLGEHQIYNASNAITASYALQDKFPKINDYAINRALQNTYWPGRLEKITYKKINDLFNIHNITVYFDGAHNEDGANILKKWLQNEKVIIISGFTKGKKWTDFIKILKPNIDYLYCICISSEPSAISGQEIAETSKTKLNINNSVHTQNLKHALYSIIQDKTYVKVQKIIICGSLFLYKDLYDFAYE